MNPQRYTPVLIYVNRTTTTEFHLGIDVSGDVLTCEIRERKEIPSDVIVEPEVTFLTDGTDGKILVTTPAALTAEIKHSNGYLNFKRLSGGEPLPVLAEALQVVFRKDFPA